MNVLELMQLLSQQDPYAKVYFLEDSETGRQLPVNNVANDYTTVGTKVVPTDVILTNYVPND